MRAVWALVLLGAAVRCWYAVDFDEPSRDARHRYLEIAGQMRAGQGFRIAGRETAMAMPLWPLTIAAWPGDPVHLNWLLSVAALPLAWLLARRIGGPRVALVALGLLALDLDGASLAGSTLTEPLLALFLLGFALAWTADKTVLAACWCGLAALTRPEAALLPFFLLPLGWKRAAVVLAGVVVALAPWTIRNAQVFDAFVPLTTNGGITLHAGMNAAEEKLSFRRKGQGRGATYLAPRDIEDEVAYDRGLRREAIAYARAHPGRALELVAAKAMLLWTPVQRKGKSAMYGLATLLCGWALVRRRRLERPIVYPMLALMTFLGLAFLAIPRYRAPYHPFVFVLAASALRGPTDPGSPTSPK